MLWQVALENRSEDLEHGSMDSRDFQLLFQSGRYNWTLTDALQMASNTSTPPKERQNDTNSNWGLFQHVFF